MDGWMNCDFTSFSTLFQSYQDDGRMIMIVCNGTPFTVEQISPRAGLELGTARSRPALNPLSYRGSSNFERVFSHLITKNMIDLIDHRSLKLRPSILLKYLNENIRQPFQRMPEWRIRLARDGH